MGLDTTHDCWHASYSTFGAWRMDIARVLGWGSEKTSYGGDTYAIPEGRIPEQGPLPDETVTTDGETYTIRWSEAYANKVWLGYWDQDPADVIDVLMMHSDCEGTIPHRFTCPLARRLTEIAQEQDDWREWTEQFVKGLLLAHERGEDVGFH
jgi:hypothetical protein